MFAGYVARATIEHNTIANTARAAPTRRPTYPRASHRPVGRSAQGYTGISLGWGWGDHVTGAQTFMADNHVASNRISAVVSELNDGELLRLPPLLHLPSLPTDDDSRLSCARRGAGGCIYTLGPQPRSSVRANYCDADRAPVVGSFYHDNGKSHSPPQLTGRLCSTLDPPSTHACRCVGSRYFVTTDNVASSSPAPCIYLQACDAPRTHPASPA